MNKSFTLVPLAALVAATAIGTAAATNNAVPRHDGGHGRHGERADSGCDSARDRAERNCAPATAATPTAATSSKRLTGTVGPGFTIKLKTSTGAPARAVRAGTYTIVVRDKSDEHNFRLRGRGVDKATAPGATGTTTWRVKLVRGTYRYVCDPHAPMMKGTLVVR
jgi:plastocyanin